MTVEDTNNNLSNEISDKNIDRMNSLRWLFFDPSHRIEAVRQTNKLILSFIIEGIPSMTSNLKSLLTDYLPADSVVIGTAQLKQRREELSEIVEQSLYAQHYNRSDDSTVSYSEDYINNFVASLELDELFWAAQVSKLELWKSYIGTIDDIHSFLKVVSEFKLTSNRTLGSQELISQSLGRFRTKVERSALSAITSIIRTIKCETYSEVKERAYKKNIA